MPGIRDMRLFVAAYETQSFTAAAQREKATQSGVSQHIRKLEDELAVKLFAREGGRVFPSPAGDRYYRHCLEVLRAHSAAGRSVEAYAKGLSGEVVVGLMPTMTRCLLAPVLSRFIMAHPNVVVRIVEGYSAMLTQQVQSDELDFAVVPAFLGPRGLRSRLFAETPEVLISSAMSPLRHADPVCLARLTSLKIVVPGKANSRRPRIEAYFAFNGIKVERLLELDSMLGTLDFVARTDWVTILPALLMMDRDRPRKFTVNTIVDPALNIELMLIEPARRPMSPAAEAFSQILEEETNSANAYLVSQFHTKQPPRRSGKVGGRR